jgi:hypothetical protein
MISLALVPAASAQMMDDSIVSKHVRMRVPMERQWLGREIIGELESCWAFMDAATHAKLPARVLVILNPQGAASTIDTDRGTISIGLADPAAVSSIKDFLLHATAREMARMALINLSGGGAAKAENLFLLEGMSELLAHEFANSVRRIDAAWAICYYMDRMSPLGLKQLASSAASGDRHSLETAAPGITLLEACRDLYGRDGRERLFKLFESLAKKSLEECLSAVFRTQAATLESQWLARLRKYSPSDATITPTDEAPVLDRLTVEPDPGKPGATLAARIYTRDGANDLSPSGIFVVDEASGKVLRPRQPGAAAKFVQCDLPIAPDLKDGRYKIQIVAVDEAGNIRNWEGSYAIVR